MIRTSLVFLSILLLVCCSTMATELSFLGLSATASGGAVHSPTAAPKLDGPLTIDGQRIVDRYGRTVILKGFNAGSKTSKGNWLPYLTEGDMSTCMNATGANFVRLYIAWRKVQPRPNEFDDEYIEAVAAKIRMFARRNIHVLIDFHMDCWGGHMASHGAPHWATDEGQLINLSTMDVSWVARYLDPVCYGAYEKLWNNQQAGQSTKGLADHYADAWCHVASKLGSIPGVIGYDLINEPFAGVEMAFIVDHLIEKFAPQVEQDALLAAFTGGSQGSLAEQATSSIRHALTEPKAYAALMDGIGHYSAGFEKRLTAFYGKIGQAIRTVDSKGMIFIEPFPLVGVGVQTALTKPDVDGVVYSPHLYDAKMDANLGYDRNPKRVARTLEQHVQTAENMGVPLVIGEWGHFNMDPVNGPLFAEHIGSMLDSAQCGTAFWEYDPGDDKDELLMLAYRPYARRIAGEISDWKFNGPTKVLTFKLQPDRTIDAPTVVAIPRSIFPNGVNVALSGATASIGFADAAGTGSGGLLVLSEPTGTLEVTVTPLRPRHVTTPDRRSTPFGD